MNTMMQNAKEENLEYIQKRVDEVIKKHCDANDEGDIKIYTDYESSYLSGASQYDDRACGGGVVRSGGSFHTQPGGGHDYPHAQPA